MARHALTARVPHLHNRVQAAILPAFDNEVVEMNEYHITRADNGFVLRYDDPEIEDANRKENAKWKDPSVTRVYETDAALVQDLAALLPKMEHNPEKTKADEYESAFNQAESKDND